MASSAPVNLRRWAARRSGQSLSHDFYFDADDCGCDREDACPGYGCGCGCEIAGCNGHDPDSYHDLCHDLYLYVDPGPGLGLGRGSRAWNCGCVSGLHAGRHEF